jgi:3-oxoacyl-[acyl-carrier protein] reductase
MAAEPVPPVAVVSGGGTGIGRATAAALAADGMDVVIVGRREDLLRATADEINHRRPAGAGQLSWARADVSDPAEVAEAAELIRQGHPAVDAVVNNAGGSVPAGTDLPSLAAAWMESYRKNVLTAVLLTSALLPMMRRPGGRVIIVGSRVAITGGASPSYVAAKAALNGWVLSLARQLGPEGITANVVAPGYTTGTELLTGRMPAERHNRIVAGIAAGRAAQPAEVAAVIRFLASKEASFVNGQVLGVDGGSLPVG